MYAMSVNSAYRNQSMQSMNKVITLCGAIERGGEPFNRGGGGGELGD